MTGITRRLRKRLLLAINNPAFDVTEPGRKFYPGQFSKAELVALSDRTDYISNAGISRMWGQ